MNNAVGNSTSALVQMPDIAAWGLISQYVAHPSLARVSRFFYQVMSQAMHSSWKQILPRENNLRARLSYALRYPLLSNWFNRETAPRMGESFLFYQTRLYNDLMNTRNQRGTKEIRTPSLAPATFHQLEDNIHQENDQNLMKVWTRLSQAMIFKGKTVPNLTNVAEVKNWLKNNQTSLDAITHLDFSNLGLTTIPQELTSLHLPNLDRLNMSNNQITKIPDRFLQNCPALTYISLRNNQIDAVPAEFLQFIRNSPNLEYADLDDNKIAIPFSLDFCRIG